MKNLLLLLLLFSISLANLHAQIKYVILDFEGYPIDETVNGREGAFEYGDAVASGVANPMGLSDWCGTTSMKVTLNSTNGYAGVGRWVGQTMELSQSADYVNFYVYNPGSQDVVITVAIQDDDDGTDTPDYTAANDDRWTSTTTIQQNSGWQLVSLPLSGFADVADGGTNGGNGIFDIGFTHGSGLCSFILEFTTAGQGFSNKEVYIDMIAFSEGALPTGASNTSYPTGTDLNGASLGGFGTSGQTGNFAGIAQDYENLYAADGETHYCHANWFLAWGEPGDGTTAQALPGSEVQTLINAGYTPMISWEPMFADLDRLNAQQPTLDQIAGGTYDSYITTFANQIATYTGTVQLRFMHEMDGDFYPWCVSQNGFDASKYINAFRHVVDVFTNANVTNVEWVWCVNALSMPQQPNNYLVNYYPWIISPALGATM